MKKMKKIKIKDILCWFIILCPILDIISFVYRNIFQTNYSPSTIIRPIIPIIIASYLFFKENKKFKIYTLIGALAYAGYGIVHLLTFKTAITGSSYSTWMHEAQYIVNYSFMIVNLFLYLHVFKSEESAEKLRKSVLIANVIYIVSIYISIITKTSSTTYIEGMGYKGWFESGNSIGAILILSLFMIISYIKEKKYRKFIIPIIFMEGIFLTILLGTRVGLLGFIFVIIQYCLTEMTNSFIQKEKVNKKAIIVTGAVLIIILLLVVGVGSTTIKRRKHLQEIESNIVEKSHQQVAHITGSLLEIKEKIDNDLLEEGYMNEAQKKSIQELYEICNQLNVKNNDQRMQQLIYNAILVKNQKKLAYLVWGNGYVANFRELVLEMEIPAFLFNFGIVGFILYFVPFLIIWIYGIYKGIKYIKKIDSHYLIITIACGFVFALSFFAGYTFFNSSNMMIIITLNAIFMQKINQLDKQGKV